PCRARDARQLIIAHRPDRVAPPDAYQGEGLLAVQPGHGGAVYAYAATDASGPIPSIRAERRGERLVVSADGPVEAWRDEGAGGLDGALARWADRFAARMGVTGARRAPRVWCSWYQYFTQVTEADVLENLEAIERLRLPIEVVQLDDGYQSGIGD